MRTQEQTRADSKGPSSDAAIAAVASGQHGVISREQLIALGVESGAIGRRLRAGRLHPLYPGVYAVGHRVVSRQGRWMAAVLFCGAGAVLSHRSAATLWGIRGHGTHAIEVTTPRKSRSRAGVQRHFSPLPADEVTEPEGIPMTTVPRTLLDLAAMLPVDAVEQALRQSERLRLYDALTLEDLLERYPRRNGVRAIRECLRRRRDLPAGVTREELEARLLTFLGRYELPRPRLNAWLMLGTHRYQADCLWPRQRVIAELDSHKSHGTWSAFEGDRDRDRRLLVAGYRTTRITWRQLHDIPGEVAADLRALLAV